MSLDERIHKLWKHLVWADEQLVDALRERSTPPALREFAHLVGSEENWLARLEGRSARSEIWPEGGLDEIVQLVERTHRAWGHFLGGLEEGDLEREIEYENSAGDTFENTIGDIVLHVVLHGQYHRGKVNLMLRQVDEDPAPVDYIAFVRGAPAATRE